MSESDSNLTEEVNLEIFIAVETFIEASNFKYRVCKYIITYCY